MKTIIAGPCQHQGEATAIVARELYPFCEKHGIDFYLKASFDKANRTSLSSTRGKGYYDTLINFIELKKEIPGLKVTTDFHEAWQISALDTFNYGVNPVDMIQIPAFLCRQTDLLRSAALSKYPVNVKKGQFVSYSQVNHIVDKLKEAEKVIITDRGFQFGYSSYVVDFIGLQHMLKTAQGRYDICLDISHSLQKPNSGSTTKGVDLDYGWGLMKAASAIGVNTFFLETMTDPSQSLSDKETTYALSEVKEKLTECLF